MRLSIILPIIFLLTISCNSSNRNAGAVSSSIEWQELKPLKLGNSKYQVSAINGVSGVFDVIKGNDKLLYLMQFKPQKIISYHLTNGVTGWVGTQKNGELSTKWNSGADYFQGFLADDSTASGPHAFLLDPRDSNSFFAVYYPYNVKNIHFSNTIKRFDIVTGESDSSFGMEGSAQFSRGFTNSTKLKSGEHFFKGIVAATYDKDFNLYVFDYTACAVYKFDVNYNFLGWIGGSENKGWKMEGAPVCGNAPGQFNKPGGGAVDSSGNLYVADTWNNRIQKFGKDGVFKESFGGADNFNTPISIKIHSDEIYVLEWQGSRLQKLDLNGKSIWKIEGLNHPFGVQVYEKEIIIADSGNARVLIYKLSSAVHE